MFSIITCTKNSEKLIDKTIKSLANQTFKEYRHIIQDCQSEDNTLKIVRSYKIKNTEIYSEKDQGIYFGLNKALKKKLCKVTCLLHAGDEFYNEDLLNKVKNIFLEKNIDILMIPIKMEISYKNFSIKRLWKPSMPNKLKIDMGWMPPHTGLFIKSSVIKNISFDESYYISSDYDFIHQLLKNNSLKWDILNLSDKFIIMDSKGESMKLKNFFKKILEDYKILKKYVKFPLFTVIMKRLNKIHQFLNFKINI
jgi:glycosyltransferase